MQSTTSWQQSTGSVLFLSVVLAMVFTWCWLASWPLAVTGHEGAIENLLTSFAFVAFGISFLAASCRQPKILFIGAAIWALAVYGSSLVLEELVQGHNVGVAIRVFSLSALIFILACAYLMRKVHRPQSI